MKSSPVTSTISGPGRTATVDASASSPRQVCSLDASTSPPARMTTAEPLRTVVARSVLFGSPSSRDNRSLNGTGMEKESAGPRFIVHPQ